MLRFVLSAACLVAAVPALAQDSGSSAAQASPAPTGPQLAVQQTAMAFVQCVQTGAQSVAATVTPEAGAGDA
jgi:hypothetical protein